MTQPPPSLPSSAPLTWFPSWFLSWFLPWFLPALALIHVPAIILVHNPDTDQKKLGMSMRVERVSVDKVREQMEAIKRKKEGITNYGTRCSG